MKYKVGDKVRVRIDLKPYEAYGDLTFLGGNMSKYTGQICTIKEMPIDNRYCVSENPFIWSKEMLEPVILTLKEIKEKKLTCCINVRSIAEAQFLDDFFECKSYLRKYCENAYKERMCLGYCRTLEDGVAFQLTDGVINDNCSANFYRSCGGRYGEVYEFSDLFATDGTVNIHDLPTTELIKREFNATWVDKKEEKKMPTKFTFYVTEGYRIDKSNNTKIPTMTTEVLYKDNDGCANGGSATCDKADYNERQGCLEAIANAVLGGNFDREYEKFLADKKRKYNESCKCKICGRNYYEDEKTGKRTPFTPEDARKHEEWHEQNKKNKRERYLLRKRAKEIAFEEQAQKMAKEIIAEDNKK